MKIDICFDVRTDSNGGDPDSRSKTLKNYHRIMWSKKLPNGNTLYLDEKLSGNDGILYSSDSICHSFSKWKKYQHIIREISPIEIEDFVAKGSTVGGFIIFPKNKINGCQSINMARGCNHNIKDRIDLTLECIRRYYNNQVSPLSECFENYSFFFDLFVDFKGYVDFFLLNDLVTEDYKEIKFLHPFIEFGDGNVLPKTAGEYLEYKKRTMKFIDGRNKRIDKIYNKTN